MLCLFRINNQRNCNRQYRLFSRMQNEYFRPPPKCTATCESGCYCTRFMGCKKCKKADGKDGMQATSLI